MMCDLEACCLTTQGILLAVSNEAASSATSMYPELVSLALSPDGRGLQQMTDAHGLWLRALHRVLLLRLSMVLCTRVSGRG
jgi:hypothetical protein